MKPLALCGMLFVLVLATSCDAPAQEDDAPAREGNAQRADGSSDQNQGAHREAGGAVDSSNADGSNADRARLGARVQDFSLTDSNGDALRLGALRSAEDGRGEIAVLTFWCSMCGSCRTIERDFDAKAREYGERGVQFLAVASNYTDSPQKANRFLEGNELRFRVLMDSDSRVARYFGARFTTTSAVLDREGRLRYYGGFRGVEAAVRNLLAGVDVAVPESPGFGCAIMMRPQSDDSGSHPVTPRGHDFAGFLAHLRERLGLTEEQAANAERVLDGLERATQSLESPSPHEFMMLRHRALQDIRAILGEEQRAKFDAFVREMQHGPESGGQGHGAGSDGAGRHGPAGHGPDHGSPRHDPGAHGANER